jgi:hypothetical protein
MKHHQKDSRGLLYDALASPHGIAVSVNNLKQLEQQLRKAQALDPDLRCLIFRVSPFNTQELWIVKQT